MDEAQIFAKYQQNGTFGDRNGRTLSAAPQNSELNQFWLRFWLDNSRYQSVTIGRQSLSFCDEILVSPNDWSNQTRAFDGFLYELERQNMYKLSAFMFKIDDDAQSYLNAEHREQDFNGIHLEHTKFTDSIVDAWIYLRNTEETQFNLSDNLTTLGFRWKHSAKRWNYNIMYAMQKGDYKTTTGTSLAYAGNMTNLEARYHLNNKRSVYLQQLSYGGSSSPDELPFQPLYGTIHNQLGKMDFFGPSNITDTVLGYDATLESNFSVSLQLHSFAINEALANPLWGPNMPSYAKGVVTNNNDNTQLGNEVDISATYIKSPSLSFEGGYSQFFPGDWFRENNGYDFNAWYAWFATKVSIF
jgi:hypothetical protein